MKIVVFFQEKRKSLTAILLLMMIASTIVIGNIQKIICYDYFDVGSWDDSCHIGNISWMYKEKCLPENWVNIHNRFWYSNDLKDVDSNPELGDLIRLYSYKIEDSDNPYYGETASLWIYDISEKMKTLEMSKDVFYNYIYDKYSKETASQWTSTDDFKPFLALCTRPVIVIKTKGSVCKESFMIFANYRIYNFHFSNAKFSLKGSNDFENFHNRCKKIIDEVDLKSYNQWEKDWEEYKELSEKEYDERKLWYCISYGIVFICCICIILLNIKTIGEENNQARLLMFYVVACLMVGLFFMAIKAFECFGSYLEDYCLKMLVLVFFPSFVIYMILITFLSKKTKETYDTFYLIPNVATRYLDINTGFKKRLALLLIFYPLFYIVPIPVGGLIVFVLYIIPMVICFGIIKTITWVWKGNKLETKQNNGSDKARLYCRHCGKLVDADSNYCRYCGKKL